MTGAIWVTAGAAFVALAWVAWALSFDPEPLGGWLPFGLIMLAPVAGYLLGYQTGKTKHDGGNWR